MEERLKTMLSALESGALSASDKSFIKKEYLKYKGEELKVSSGCQNCWHDAIIELLVSLKENKILMAAGFVFEFEGKLYNRHNLTDKIATKFIDAFPEKQIYFFKK